MRAVRIGELLMQHGVLTGDQVSGILAEQRQMHRRFGDLAERLFGVDRRRIEEAWARREAAARNRPRLSIIMPARNGREMTHRCLVSLNAVRQLCLAGVSHEVILIDDASDASEGMVDLFRTWKQRLDVPVRAVRCNRHQHYTGVFAIGMSLARGENLLLVSNDMVVTPSFVETVMEVAELDATFGIVRGKSGHTDSFSRYNLPLPLPPRKYEDISGFARYVREYFGLQWREDDLLSGDCVLIKRGVLDAVGVFDRRFFGYFGDVDYGLRVQRAGYRLVAAEGAWLHHTGAGHVVHESRRTGLADDEALERRLRLVQAAYEPFRRKWCPEWPGMFNYEADLESMIRDHRLAGRYSGEIYCPPVGNLSDEVTEL